MPLRTIVFDFDGTIADTMEEGRNILNHLSSEYGFKEVEKEHIPSLREMQLNELLKHLGISKLLVPILISKGTRLLKERIASLPLIEGIGDILPLLREQEIHCGILTSNSEENVNLFLKSHGLEEHFSFVSSTSKLTGKAKHLRSICRTFSCQPEHLLYVGDEVRDIKACKRAGVPIISVSWGFNAKQVLASSAPDYLIDDPAELITAIHDYRNSLL
ncbi:phosphoglycolate phosphatase [Rubritalea squalenifaciens DSM 18772]|uniref:Phosphoglycolate phosphatase n=1 Tax=Rubritalea squalenifaciens DSM 18772 TaxID=1123071 RepID=A0A1M6I5J2_9BACT|nr:HAD-IA family hydrolase [Rubritalea squalenifaciens]SHJ29699.1 phosphoglycolate phosphatase [Rubritalea squalenifaciens DSM 18772]